MNPPSKLVVIGGGLAGCEAAWQAVRRGVAVELWEMKPRVFSPAHRSPDLAELVCSNSLRSRDLHNAAGLLKAELGRLGSLIMEAALVNQVPAGKSLAVDREAFARHVTEKITGHPGIRVERREAVSLPSERPLVVAGGPLTSAPLAQSLARLVGSEQLHFYDAIAPIVQADSIDEDRVYRGSRYGHGGEDYINCPLDEAQYERFLQALLTAAMVPLQPFEDPRYFEGCLPIEVMAGRGRDTLRYGPMKPVGLPDPRTGQIPYAVVQLRQDNRSGTLFNLVGFQTKLKWPEQQRVFRLIPGLERAEFARLGSIHRNTFLEGPKVLGPSLQLKADPGILLAGQITGVEGYVESTAMGLLAGINAERLLRERPPVVPPATTALGALIGHISREPVREFQPMNVNFGLFPPLEGKVPKKLKGERLAQRALEDLEKWIGKEGLE
ncbi:MAG: methylenetetrahydrofolate--tRNA-(uracil(54)-C(5))-methyltransferase (FADH(2)-oxidizing) TrmFO [Desulfobacterota bacterium]|nr:methylenetetrahydrofolate--tRNA-(uracil(54)-C(5))-methyltransferase (FADH(2)-oxidizing) TrmFO [Thermodesulfobacteriota bacterium]